jgi:hypothetical protein
LAARIYNSERRPKTEKERLGCAGGRNELLCFLKRSPNLLLKKRRGVNSRKMDIRKSMG